MRIAYIDHSFHRRTNSNTFLADLLGGVAHVDRIWDDAWRGGNAVNPADVEQGDYDHIVIFQAEETMRSFARAGLSEKVVFVPMFDSSGDCGPEFWRHEIGGARVLCFCRRQFEQVVRCGVNALFVQYFPDPAGISSSECPVLSGFFWWRRNDLSWPVILRLTEGAPFEKMHIHLAPDPGVVLDEESLRAAPFPISVSRWGDDSSAYQRALRAASVFFAPRLQEGIGQSFLEAMSAGMVVVAPDRPTMNEYFADGVTGHLYDPGNPRPIDFSAWKTMAGRAREAALRGRREWEKSAACILEWVTGERRVPAERVWGADSLEVDFLVDGGGRAREKTRASLRLEEHPGWRCAASPNELRRDAWVVPLETGDELLDPSVLDSVLPGCDAEVVLFHYVRDVAGAEEWWRTAPPAVLRARGGGVGDVLRRWPHPSALAFAPGRFFVLAGNWEQAERIHHADRFLTRKPERGPRPILRHLRAGAAAWMPGLLDEEERRVCAAYRESGFFPALRWMAADAAMPRFAWLTMWEPIRFYGLRGGCRLFMGWLKKLWHHSPVAKPSS